MIGHALGGSGALENSSRASRPSKLGESIPQSTSKNPIQNAILIMFQTSHAMPAFRSCSKTASDSGGKTPALCCVGSTSRQGHEAV